MITLGTTLFSLTPDWRAGATVVELLERVAAVGCGPAAELVGAQAWSAFPGLDPADVATFRAEVDRLGLAPTALGVYLERHVEAGRPRTDEQVLAALEPQLATAAALGFPLARLAAGPTGDLLRRAVELARWHGVALSFEVQGTNDPAGPAVAAVLDARAEYGAAAVGFTLDLSLTTPALPAAFDTVLHRRGAGDLLPVLHAAWAAPGPLGPRLGRALAATATHPHAATLEPLVAGVFVRTGRWTPVDWAHVLPAVDHVHAKFWDPDPEAVRPAYRPWLAALLTAGYDGAVVSEWGGHEFLDRADVDALTAVAANHRLLGDLLAELGAPVAAGVPA